METAAVPRIMAFLPLFFSYFRARKQNIFHFKQLCFKQPCLKWIFLLSLQPQTDIICNRKQR